MFTGNVARFSVIFLCFGLVFSLSIPHPDASAEQELSGTRQGSQGNWTFMVYMSGDSSLNNNVPPDLDEMKQVGSDDSLNIITLVDRSGSADTQLLRVKTTDTESIPLSNVTSSWGNELNLGNPETLVDFVTWAVDTYPAEHYVLDLWGHGTGWQGVCPDKGDSLTTQELRTAMDSISDEGVTLDIVSIDACQMGMIETVYELRHASNYAIVSEKDVPLSGWPYDDVLTILADNPDINVESFGRGMINAYVNWGLAHSRYSLTLSLIDLEQMPGVINALDAYFLGVSKTVGYFNQEIVLARSVTEKYDGSHEYDLWHLIKNIQNTTEYLRSEALSDVVFSSLSACVVYERHWTNNLDEPADHAHGLSIWFPNSEPPTSYRNTGFCQDTFWDEILTQMAPYFSSPAKTEVSIEVNAESVDTDSDGLNDQLEFSCFIPSSPANTLFEIEVYGPNGSMAFYYEGGSSGWHNLNHTPEALGKYSAAFYLLDVNGNLVNYSFKNSGLNREGWSEISGHVTSNIGRGLKWTQISLYDSEGNLIDSTTSGMDGSYALKVRVPTETDGVNLTLSCGLGAQRQNVTLEQLFSVNNIDFTVESAHISVLWLTYAALVVNILALAFLAVWIFFNRRKRDEISDTAENEMF